jgi:hypothetical protein
MMTEERVKSEARSSESNTNETLVPHYELPDPLVGIEGARVGSEALWLGYRRDEILDLFSEHVYGRTPQQQTPVSTDDVVETRGARGGRVIRKHVTLRFGSAPTGPAMHLR